jgi:hypothetical protein
VVSHVGVSNMVEQDVQETIAAQHKSAQQHTAQSVHCQDSSCSCGPA